MALSRAFLRAVASRITTYPTSTKIKQPKYLIIFQQIKKNQKKIIITKIMNYVPENIQKVSKNQKIMNYLRTPPDLGNLTISVPKPTNS